MATGAHVWSTTAASNGNIDSAITASEGQAPSTVNDGMRGIMAKVSEMRKDQAGTLTTAGTSTAYTIASPNATYASLSELDGVKLCVRFNATNGAAPTLNVASLGAKAIQTASGTAVATGAILANSVHELTYDNSIPAFLIHGAFDVQPKDATLTALAGVTTAADKLIYATGSDAFSTTDFTAAGRALVDDASASAQRTTLGLGTAAVEAIGTSGDALGKLNANKTDAGTNTFSGANTFSNAAGVTAKNTVKAFGSIVNGALTSNSFNIASVTDNGTSHTISFTNAMAGTTYTVILTLDRENAAAPTYILGYSSRTTGGFNVEAAQPTVSNNLDPDSYSIMVLEG